jgi:hypothetical protein
MMAAALIAVPQARSAHAQDIWFSPRSASGYAEDFYRLFDRDAPWQRAAGNIKAFELSIQLETQASDENLRKVIGGLRERHIALGLDMLPLTGRGERVAPNGCGFHVEGYASQRQSHAVAQHFKALGAEVAYFVMDEPLFYGHFFNGTNACHSAVEDLIADVAEKVEQVRSQYAEVPVGETEPIIAVTKYGLTDLDHWLDAFAAATGKPLAFLRLDMDWNTQWQPQVVAVAQLLRRKGVPLQVVYNGMDRDGSDEAWIAHAKDHAQKFEAAVKPAVVVIQSWSTYPKRVLPESDPATMTGLVNQYVAMHRPP